MSDDEASSVLPTLPCIVVGIISAFISLHHNSLLISLCFLSICYPCLSISSLYFLSLLPKERKKKRANTKNRNRVIDTENKQVVARREVDGRKKELSEED